MSTYTVTLTSESTGKITSKTIEADDARAAVSSAYLDRYNVTPGQNDIRPRGMDISDCEFIVIGTAGAVTLADVEPVEDTVSTYQVWRCAGRSGSMYAKRDAFGFVEVYQSNIDAERAAGTHLFKITL
jgi:hypothetical protein